MPWSPPRSIQSPCRGRACMWGPGRRDYTAVIRPALRTGENRYVDCMTQSEDSSCERCGRTLVRLAGGVLLACTACLTPITAASAPVAQLLPAVMAIRSVQPPTGPVGYYSLAEMRARGELGSRLDDHDMPETEGTYRTAGPGIVGSVGLRAAQCRTRRLEREQSR